MNERDSKGRKVPFSLEYYPLSRVKKTMGPLTRLEKQVTCGYKHNLNKKHMISVRRVDNSDHPRPVYIPMIMKFNDKKVLP